ncbi:hypothetical protein BKA64DRAFT_707019 [Cadophora sp. MPI-SDFR-AT-0126]|nr:hypothetical protein BKA64DRAFT_707019 [Leotiomycetes sp. MPI-SDFR-AT-0126]
MSPRNDTFLSLCLAQADLSPLHYRHGAIIVRGGKVIGQGFNCYRPGFDGGALRNGALPSASLDGPAIAELKQRLKSKPNSKSKMPTQSDEGTFTPFESMGCGHNANVALSMHSEMMAIRSALSLSSGTQASQTSARSAMCFEKPCFKPEHVHSKTTPKPSARRPRRQALAKPLLQSRDLNPVHLNQVQGYNGNVASVKEEDNGFQNQKVNENVAATTWKSAEKQRLKKGPSYLYQYGHQYEGHYHHMAQQKHDAHKGGLEPQSKISKSIPITDSQSSSSEDDFIRTPKSKAEPPKKAPIPTKPQQILITKNKSSTKPSTAARTKDLRLKGSDLYVARLGHSHKTPSKKGKSPSTECPELPPPPVPPKSPPASLHDELSPLSRSVSPSVTSKTSPDDEVRPEIRASRPCYRCVSAMHAVGIKRVFWTTQDGEWEMAKVRDLVDALEVGIDGDGNSNGEGLGMGQESKGVFVTKHEVLMLKRSMGF